MSGSGEVRRWKGRRFSRQRFGAQALAAADGAGRSPDMYSSCIAIAVAAGFVDEVAQEAGMPVEALVRGARFGGP